MIKIKRPIETNNGDNNIININENTTSKNRLKYFLYMKLIYENL